MYSSCMAKVGKGCAWLFINGFRASSLGLICLIRVRELVSYLYIYILIGILIYSSLYTLYLCFRLDATEIGGRPAQPCSDEICLLTSSL
ncbi:hypothetical protein F4813DRAFT_344204 [Daldinia decipiens]|uniref:uncharacterized protein n=1 Tax=Daldinia decipiens TaxID=326647 RepID=UPI0020C3A931|nr:uncharacterized protein F4813DRAFT_344204 [Daldinia decipiens]KAI1662341.1 hypothetical protein F4813DRAFT_344204 [Daldinia decipiens]